MLQASYFSTFINLYLFIIIKTITIFKPTFRSYTYGSRCFRCKIWWIHKFFNEHKRYKACRSCLWRLYSRNKTIKEYERNNGKRVAVYTFCFDLYCIIHIQYCVRHKYSFHGIQRIHVAPISYLCYLSEKSRIRQRLLYDSDIFSRIASSYYRYNKKDLSIG